MESILGLIVSLLGHAVGLLVDPFFWLVALGLSFIPHAGRAVALAVLYGALRVAVIPALLGGEIRPLWLLYVVWVAICVWTVAAALRYARARWIDKDPRKHTAAGGPSGQDEGRGGVQGAPAPMASVTSLDTAKRGP